MDAFATVDDVRTLWRSMTAEEEERCEALLPIIAARLRHEAHIRHYDLDEMMEEDECLAEIAKMISVDVVARTLMTSTDMEPLSQFSESAGGYTVSGTYLTPGGGLFIKNAELAELGILRQRYGTVSLYDGHYKRHGCHAV